MLSTINLARSKVFLNRRFIPSEIGLFSLHTNSPSEGKSMQNIKEDVEEFIPPHYKSTTGGKFTNPWPTWEERTFKDMWKWSRERRSKGLTIEGYLINNKNPSPQEFLEAFPPVHPDTSALASPPSNAVQAFWIGHATVLVQLEGFNFLTDPVFAERCSPVSFLGPKRVVPPALTIDQLPRIDAVLLSHNHYDHLCDTSVRALHAKQKDIKWFVPLGLRQWFKRRGIAATEADWWQEIQLTEEVKVVFTPAQHWSARGIFDRKQTLWGSWAVIGQKLRFWFSGDTGYAPVFEEIGKKYGPFDLSAIATGAYSPRWFMRPQHIDPEEALKVHQDIKSRRSFAIHCCTFCLTDEPMDEPVLLLKEHAAKMGMTPDEFITLRHGAHLVTRNGIDLNTPLTMPMPVLDAAVSEYVPAA